MQRKRCFGFILFLFCKGGVSFACNEDLTLNFSKLRAAAYTNEQAL